MKKRVLALTLTMVMILALLPAAAAENEFVIEDGVLMEYNGPGGDVVIPGGVTEIGDHAFDGCAALTGVTIPDSVTRIGGAAFMNCTALTHVAIPNGVTEIEICTFEGCTSLESVVIPQSVTEIGGGAFEFCESLNDVTLPDGLSVIGENAFRCCYGLTGITIPASVAEVWHAPFEYCTGLTEVNFADGVTKIWPVMFSNCTSLTSVNIPDSVTEIELWAFQGCTSLTDVVIPDSVTRIGDAAFWKCAALTDATVPASVAEIGDHAFQDCPSLTLHGAAGSRAESYAAENGIPFAATSETPRFTDVEVGSWYEAAVELCAAKGIMIGTSETTFSPEATLTEAECSVLALRLHDLLHGGDGVFDPAPEDWGGGRIVLTLVDGTQLASYGETPAPLPGLEGGEFTFSCYSNRRDDPWGTLMVKLTAAPGRVYQGNSEEWIADLAAAEAWGEAREGEASVTINGETFQGRAWAWRPLGWEIQFDLKAEDYYKEIEHFITALRRALSDSAVPGAWYRDAAYYADQNKLDVEFSKGVAKRADFAVTLAMATGELPQRQMVNYIPGVPLKSEYYDDVYMLYQAGVLTGKDNSGYFDAGGTLTRAEAATMVARVLDEDLRLGEPLAPLPAEE